MIILTRYLNIILVLAVTMIYIACANSGAETTEEWPQWSFSEDMIFPVDRPLMVPEDGIALPDGRLIVSDRAYGLREILDDGTTRPFGRFSEAGYVHEPPLTTGGADGVTLEPAGTHILVSDVYNGGIYRVDIASEETKLIYEHTFGVNMARGDSKGGIWFTQSTQNAGENAVDELWGAINEPVPDGAVYYLTETSGSKIPRAVLVADSLYFANGIDLDEQMGYLYVAELMAGRVLRYRMEIKTGQVTEPKVVIEMPAPDNLELDEKGRLWIADAVRSEIVVHDLATGISKSVFRIATPQSEALILELERRRESGEPILDLYGPDWWEPAPGSITGLILSPNEGPVYVTNLGDALIRLER